MPLVVPGINSTSGNNPSEQWTNLLMGKKLGEQSNETSFAKKELPQNHRVIEEGGFGTTDFQKDRLNIHLDKEGVVNKVTHG